MSILTGRHSVGLALQTEFNNAMATQVVFRGALNHERNVYAVCTSRQFIDAKITHFIDTLKSRVGTELMMTAQELID